MSDIDFDELDKAVASVLEHDEPTSQKPETSPPALTPPAENTPPTSDSRISSHGVHARMAPGRSTLQDTQLTHQATEVTPVERSQTHTQPSSEPSLATRRSGRFMDIVHPAADMQRRGEARAALRRKRETVVQPVAAPTIEQLPAPESDPSPQAPLDSAAPLPLPESQTTDVSDNSAQEVQPHNYELEKAIDELLVSEGHTPVVSTVETEASKEKVEELVPEVMSTKPAAVSTHENHLPEPTRLSDVVGGSEAGSQSEEAPTDQVTETALPDQNTTSEPAEQNISEPEEDADISQLATEFESTPLASDNPQTTPFLKDTKVEKRPLGAIPPPNQESEQPPEQIKNPPEPVEKEEPSTDDFPEELHNDLVAIESGNAVKKDDEIAPIEEKPPVTSSVNSATVPAMTSIPRQYKEAPQQLDEEESSVFDTNTYHQPLETATKKKTNKGWIVFTIILLLVILGVAAVFAWLSGLLVVPF